MTQAVFFDVDGVLLDSLAANIEFYQELFRAVGYRVPSAEEFALMHHLPTWDVIQRVTGLTESEEIQKIWDISQQLEYDATIFPTTPLGVEETLRKLQGAYALGIVTSRSKKWVFEGPLEKLKKYFQTDVSFEDTTLHKPHPEPLLVAAQRVGVRPNESVYIGDSPSDIEAAKAAGMKMILYGRVLFGGPDLHVSSFTDIPAAVKGF